MGDATHMQGQHSRARIRGRERCLRLLVGSLLLLALAQLSVNHHQFDVLNHFFPQICVLAAAGAAGACFPQRQLLAAFIVVVFGLIAIGLSPAVFTQASEVISGNNFIKNIKIMSFNTAAWNRNGAAVIPEVKRQKPDIVAFVELGPATAGRLKDLSEEYPYGISCASRVYCNLAILSRFPVKESMVRGRWNGPPLVRLDFGSELGGLTVIGIHMTRFPNVEEQFRQGAALAEWLRAIGGPQVIIGDFNATPFSQVLRRFASDTGLTRLTWLPTWPSAFGLPQLAIDHMFVTQGIAAVEQPRLGESAGSDHYPVIATLAVPVASGN